MNLIKHFKYLLIKITEMGLVTLISGKPIGRICKFPQLEQMPKRQDFSNCTSFVSRIKTHQGEQSANMVKINQSYKNCMSRRTRLNERR